MAPRVDSELLLVGSLPADSADSALRAAAGFFGTWCSRCRTAKPAPGRPGSATSGSGWSARTRASSSCRRPSCRPASRARVRDPGVRHPARRHRAALGFLAAHRRRDRGLPGVQRAARDGVIPAGLRFQVGLPFPASALNGFKADFATDYPVAARAFEDLVARELARLTAAIPPADLAIQWDLAYETQDLEGVLAWTGGRRVGAVRRAGHPADPADPGRKSWSATTCATGRSRNGRCTRRATWGCWCGWRTSRSRTPGARWTGCTWPDRGTCAARTAASSGRWPTWSRATPGSSWASCCRSTGCRAAAQARHGLALPFRLRRGDVLRVRPPARRGRHRDHARARPRGPHRPQRLESQFALSPSRGV